MKRAWPLIVLLFTGCATFHALFREDRPPFIPSEAAHIHGAHSRAIGVAFEDFMADRAREKAEAEAVSEDAGDGGGGPALERRAVNSCLDRPDAYETWIYPGDAGTSYIVVITLGGFCFSGEKGLYEGDRVVYEIGAETFQIMKKQIEE
ncbi:MAG TPA: hypothetical protein VND93_00160 [Myxococcales bacterium]|nr:hypothetical protein [Myxococcales bacterium]